MTRRRFYAPASAFSANGDSVVIATDEARHLRDVLRLKAGDEVYVFDGAGKEFHCRIEESRRDTAKLKVIAAATPASIKRRAACSEPCSIDATTLVSSQASRSVVSSSRRAAFTRASDVRSEAVRAGQSSTTTRSWLDGAE